MDRKTGEHHEFLFCVRGAQIGKAYLNDTVLPALCRKAGIPESDSRGALTSHRARSTIATQLLNAPDQLSFVDPKEWLGHKHFSSIRHYAAILQRRLTAAYHKADYFARLLGQLSSTHPAETQSSPMQPSSKPHQPSASPAFKIRLTAPRSAWGGTLSATRPYRAVPSPPTPSGAKVSSTRCRSPASGPARSKIVQLLDHDTFSTARNTPLSSVRTRKTSPSATFRTNQGMLSSRT